MLKKTMTMLTTTNYELFLPESDGVNHINIYSQGKTELGKLLSHFSHTPFVHPYFGPFNSMEGFWYYLKAEVKDEKLRQLYGAEAKFYGKKIPSVRIKHFNLLIIDANFHKVNQNPKIANLMVQSNLPFDHYYVDNRVNIGQKIKLKGFEWLIEGFEKIREDLKTGNIQHPLDYDSLLRQ